MSAALRPGLSFCVIGGVALFLDLPGDRYFRLPEKLNDALLAIVDGRSESADLVTELAAAGVLQQRGSGQPIRPVAHVLPTAASLAIADGAFRLGDVARVLAAQRRTEWQLRRTSLSEILHKLTQERATGAAHFITPGSGAARIVRAFEAARLLRSAANRCLTRSIALARCLAREGVQADVVLAVRLGPFAAHCWAQLGDAVLNDTPEEVARFTPILVV